MSKPPPAQPEDAQKCPWRQSFYVGLGWRSHTRDCPYAILLRMMEETQQALFVQLGKLEHLKGE